MSDNQRCSDCVESGFERRDFLKVAGTVTAISTAGLSALPALGEEKETKPTPENLVKKLYDSLDEKQKEEIAFAWDYVDDRGLLRSHVSNNWQITKPMINSEFFTKDQQDMIEALFFGMYNPDWHDRIRKQLKDDAGGYGKSQSIAFFGEPGAGKFEFVMTGRHLTHRCDGDSREFTAFGGPIFYGHAASGFNEAVNHPGNVYWHQAKLANKLYEILDGKQRKVALVPKRPEERMVHFQGAQGTFPGIPVTELTTDQKTHLDTVLASLLEPFRKLDQDEAKSSLKAQGGLEKCSIAFYQEGDLGDDGEWDNWRLEGPSFVWYFRGTPHVHVWVNVASDPSVKITTAG